eukprot:453980-Heterocapsa_arctica.AAC.1
MLLNTWWPNASGSTWTNGRGSHSRIDYIAVPKSFSSTVAQVTLRRRTAILLQRAPHAQWIDHCPVCVDCWRRLWFNKDTNGTQPRPWDTYRAAKLLREPSTVASITHNANDWASSIEVLDAFALAE